MLAKVGRFPSVSCWGSADSSTDSPRASTRPPRRSKCRRRPQVAKAGAKRGGGGAIYRVRLAWGCGSEDRYDRIDRMNRPFVPSPTRRSPLPRCVLVVGVSTVENGTAGAPGASVVMYSWGPPGASVVMYSSSATARSLGTGSSIVVSSRITVSGFAALATSRRCRGCPPGGSIALRRGEPTRHLTWSGFNS